MLTERCEGLGLAGRGPEESSPNPAVGMVIVASRGGGFSERDGIRRLSSSWKDRAPPAVTFGEGWGTCSVSRLGEEAMEVLAVRAVDPVVSEPSSEEPTEGLETFRESVLAIYLSQSKKESKLLSWYSWLPFP